ncbi:MAG: carbonic anhydrase [Hyphococcus sp.]|nr:MAG: carbonic anhydrase [Marinicaulis sp.]
MTVVALLGGGGHAKVCLEAARAAGLNVDFACAPESKALSIYDGLEIHPGPDDAFIDAMASDVAFVIGVGGIASRRSLAELLSAGGRALALIVHPCAIVSETSILAPGALVAAGGVVNPGASIGAHAVINTSAVVEHDCRVGEGGFIGPGAILAGEVTVGDWAFVGAGAVVLPGVCIAAGAVVGAGTVVTKDVAAGETVVGAPARRIS